MNKKVVDTLSIYVTHNCGLSCNLCASYNNYTVKGHYDWNTAKQRLDKWGELLEIRQITIIGGEPFLHPDIDTWVKGTVNSFKDCKDIRVFTGLTGDKLLKYQTIIKEWFNMGVVTQISVHDPKDWELSIETAEKILGDIEYKKVTGVDNCSFVFKKVEYFIKDKLVFTVYEQWDFFPHSQKEVKDGKIYMHDNDPELAHSKCHAKSCHYIVDGYLYKCVLTGISKMILEQLPVGDREQSLLSQVEPIDPFVTNDFDFSSAIPQCSLCSIQTEKLIPIYPLSTKKPRLIK